MTGLSDGKRDRVERITVKEGGRQRTGRDPSLETLLGTNYFSSATPPEMF